MAEKAQVREVLFVQVSTLRIGCAVVSLTIAALPRMAFADTYGPEDTKSLPSTEVPNTPDSPPASSSATAVSGGSAARAAAPLDPKFAEFDKLLEPGNTSTFPGSADTATQDAGGYRSWLADHNIGFRSIVSANLTWNPLSTGQPDSPQRYNGQKFTVNSASENFEVSWRLDKLGAPNTMLFFGMNNTNTSFYPNGPSSLYIRNLGIYQSLFNGHLTIKAGFTPNYYEYVGLFVGGSPILAAGIPGLLPVQAGLGADLANVPVVNVTAYGKQGSYVRVGVQRSTSVRGIPDEVEHRHGLGLHLTFKDAGPLYIGEVGIRRPAAAGTHQMWLRAGGFYNDSNYVRFDGRGTSANASLYALADRQITQPDQTAPGRGMYVGASAFWIPQSVNTGTQSYEARAYVIGALASRPKDTATIRVTYNKFSHDARDAQRARGIYANDDQLNITGSYSARVTHGLYVTPGVSYAKNPSFIGDFKDALIGSLSLFVIV